GRVRGVRPGGCVSLADLRRRRAGPRDRPRHRRGTWRNGRGDKRERRGRRRHVAYPRVDPRPDPAHSPSSHERFVRLGALDKQTGGRQMLRTLLTGGAAAAVATATIAASWASSADAVVRTSGPVFDPNNFVAVVDNPYFPLPVGR